MMPTAAEITALIVQVQAQQDQIAVLETQVQAQQAQQDQFAALAAQLQAQLQAQQDQIAALEAQGQAQPDQSVAALQAQLAPSNAPLAEQPASKRQRLRSPAEEEVYQRGLVQFSEQGARDQLQQFLVHINSCLETRQLSRAHASGISTVVKAEASSEAGVERYDSIRVTCPSAEAASKVFGIIQEHYNGNIVYAMGASQFVISREHLEALTRFIEHGVPVPEFDFMQAVCWSQKTDLVIAGVTLDAAAVNTILESRPPNVGVGVPPSQQGMFNHCGGGEADSFPFLSS